MARIQKMRGGRNSSRCKAGLMPSRLSKQSVERLPLVREEKAQLVALEIQCMVLGTDALMLPSRLVYLKPEGKGLHGKDGSI